jgi:plastocyanin
MGRVRLSIVGTLLVCTACSRPNEYANLAPPAAAPVVTNTSSDGPQTVTGTVRTAGAFPSIVIFEPEGEPDRSPQIAPPVMDQVQESFTPPVLLVRTGQPVEFHNSDEVLHNVRVRDDATKTGAFNVAIPTDGKYVYTFMEDGYYDVGCDIHPAMAAQIIATTSPYTTLADPQGRFVIEGVPTGSYKVTVYAGADHLERTLTIAKGQLPLDLTQ